MRKDSESSPLALVVTDPFEMRRIADQLEVRTIAHDLLRSRIAHFAHSPESWDSTIAHYLKSLSLTEVRVTDVKAAMLEALEEAVSELRHLAVKTEMPPPYLPEQLERIWSFEFPLVSTLSRMIWQPRKLIRPPGARILSIAKIVLTGHPLEIVQETIIDAQESYFQALGSTSHPNRKAFFARVNAYLALIYAALAGVADFIRRLNPLAKLNPPQG